MELEKSIYMADLFSIYKQLLTKKQVEICELYYLSNLGLTEIGERLKITRQGVLDTLNKANAQLTEFESKLHLKEKFDKVLNLPLDKTLKEKVSDILGGE